MQNQSTLARHGLALLALTLALAGWPLPNEANGNQVDINGTGGGQSNINEQAQDSVIDLYQVGSVGTANQAGSVTSPLTQAGSGHLARIGQGATWSGGVWTPGTAVAGNTATISQTGAGHQAAIYQTSDGNTATLVQNSSGAAMTAAINQNGTSASQVIATQDGSASYTLTVTQQGAGGHAATVETTSGYSGAGVSVNQSGITNTASVTGMSGGSASINQLGSGGYVNLANQSNGILAITQQAGTTGAALSIANYGAGVSLSVTQTPAAVGGGVDTLYNPNPAPTGPTYSTSKP